MLFRGRGLQSYRKESILVDSENESHLKLSRPYPVGCPTVIDKAIPLNQLRIGQSALVSRVLGAADHVHRLEEFGLRGGARIQMFRPGNPCIVRLAGSKICFRMDQLVGVYVEPDAVSH